MALFSDTIHVDSPCSGCLSSDRKLSHVPTEKINYVFHNFLYSNNLISNQWCYECEALIERVLKFKTQVKKAQHIIAQFMIKDKSHFQSLSRLSNYTNNNIIQMTHEEYKGTSNAQNVYEFKVKKEGLEESPFGEEYVLCEDSQFVVVKSDDFSYVEESQPSPEVNTEAGCADFDDSDNEPLLNIQKEKHNKKIRASKARKPKERPPGVVTSKRVMNKLKQLNISTDTIQMIVLSWEQVEEERQKMLKSDSFTRHQYRCYDCAVGFNHRIKYDNHMIRHDKSPNGVCCNICTVNCRNNQALTSHIRRHQVRWRCSLCDSLWSRLSVAADHLHKTHDSGGRDTVFRCHVCGEGFQTHTKLRSHKKVHSERVKCELCGKTFIDSTSLRTHMFIHNADKEFSCPKCDKKFLFKKRMEIHMMTHEKSELLYCHECDKNFKNKICFYQHMKYNLKHVDQKLLKHSCNLCDKKFVKASRLEEHNNAVHLKISPVQCHVDGCLYSCSTPRRLRCHISVVHDNVKPKRNHVCHTCGKSYTSKKCLEGHLHSHSSTRHYRCDSCEASFSYQSALYNHHKLRHKGKKSQGLPTTEEYNE